MSVARFVIALTSFCIAGAGTARADVVLTLYNTGHDNNHNPLANGAIDPHYTIISSPDLAFPGPNAFSINNNALPIQSGWFGNNATSRWIGPRADGLDNAVGNYTYRTTFSLAGYNPASASISGRWAMDNTGVDILLNGVSKGISRPGEFNFFNFSPQWIINSGFVQGSNTLDFIVFNMPTNPPPNPTGLRTEMTLTASPVPEPSSLLLIMGAIVLGRNRLKKIELLSFRSHSSPAGSATARA